MLWPGINLDYTLGWTYSFMPEICLDWIEFRKGFEPTKAWVLLYMSGVDLGLCLDVGVGVGLA